MTPGRYVRLRGRVDTYNVTALVRQSEPLEAAEWAFCWVWKSTKEDWAPWQWWVEPARSP